MIGGFAAIPRLAEQAIFDADDAVTADHPRTGDADRLRDRQLLGDPRGIGQSKLELFLVHLRPLRLVLDAGGIEHLSADRAGRGKDKGQPNNLVEKRRRNASPLLGTISTGEFGNAPHTSFEDLSTGTKIIPSL